VKKRTIPGAEERIYEDLRWAGLLWDEGSQGRPTNWEVNAHAL
jgi:glutamyl/glutaminyl-tRNA synthetase